MIDFTNETDHDIDETIFDTIGAFLSSKDVECIIVDSQTIRQLNLDTRGMDKATDVLSFPLEATPINKLIGSIVICYDIANEFAKTFGHETSKELQLLFIHGMLHLLGFDHETDQGQMRDEEEKVIKYFDLPKSLIIRNQE